MKEWRERGREDRKGRKEDGGVRAERLRMARGRRVSDFWSMRDQRVNWPSVGGQPNPKDSQSGWTWGRGRGQRLLWKGRGIRREEESSGER
jgi:hypothetical protein